jgi:hypothetical protein
MQRLTKRLRGSGLTTRFFENIWFNKIKTFTRGSGSSRPTPQLPGQRSRFMIAPTHHPDPPQNELQLPGDFLPGGRRSHVSGSICPDPPPNGFRMAKALITSSCRNLKGTVLAIKQ